ncbi:MAG: peptidoglycan DD-metalloendopeptidase family protein [Myxococcota bacterium]
MTFFFITLAASMAFGQDRAEELEDIREAIADSRGRVGEHSAGELAILDELEQADRRLQKVTRKWTAAGREVAEARRQLKQIEPELEAAATALGRTQRALSTRANALYRGGELGPVRVIFSAETLPELLSRAGALRVLVRHDAGLVGRYREERDQLERLEIRARDAIQEREKGRLEVTRLVARLEAERGAKSEILDQLRKDRKSERRLLLELEQAAQALEETIRTLGVRVREGERGLARLNFSARQGFLTAPVEAEISLPFGRVIDPEFHTATFRSGVDFAARAGSVVRSVGHGVIRFAGWFRGYGRIVIIDHGGGFHSICGHLDEIFVDVGDRVSEADRLGSVGETGSLGGPSLYFELRRNGEAIDPEPWLAARRG